MNPSITSVILAKPPTSQLSTNSLVQDAAEVPLSKVLGKTIGFSKGSSLRVRRKHEYLYLISRQRSGDAPPVTDSYAPSTVKYEPRKHNPRYTAPRIHFNQEKRHLATIFLLHSVPIYSYHVLRRLSCIFHAALECG
jgi:hypothetical protein